MGHVSGNGTVVILFIILFLIIILFCLILMVTKTFVYIWHQYKLDVVNTVVKYKLLCQRLYHKERHKSQILFTKVEQAGFRTFLTDTYMDDDLYRKFYKKPWVVAEDLVQHRPTTMIGDIIFFNPYELEVFISFSKHKIKNHKRLKPFLKLANMFYEGGKSSYGSQGLVFYDGLLRLFGKKFKREIRLTKIKIILDFIYWIFTKKICNFATNIFKNIKHGNKN